MPRGIFRFVTATLMLGAVLASGPEARASSLVVDAETGKVISADQPNHLWYPASLTKMMTVYVTLGEIEAGRLALEDKIKVSTVAASATPVRFGLRAGEVISVRQAINAAIVASANDAALALAEKIGGTEEAFANLMTQTAWKLGMTRTIFRNATGLPDEDQVTTAHDMALLALAVLRDYPRHYALFNQRSVTIGGRSRPTVNGILGSYSGADGLKTGFTCGSGYNLVASAQRSHRRVIAVLLGSMSRSQRTAEITRLLDSAFAGDLTGKLPLSTLMIAAADEGAPPTVLTSAACNVQGDDETLIAKTAHAGEWAIIFGSYVDKAKAQMALSAAKATLGELGGSARGVIAPKADSGVKQWAAMIVGLSQRRAGQACKTLWAKNSYCLALRPNVLADGSMAWR